MTTTRAELAINAAEEVETKEYGKQDRRGRSRLPAAAGSPCTSC